MSVCVFVCVCTCDYNQNRETNQDGIPVDLLGGPGMLAHFVCCCLVLALCVIIAGGFFLLLCGNQSRQLPAMTDLGKKSVLFDGKPGPDDLILNWVELRTLPSEITKTSLFAWRLPCSSSDEPETSLMTCFSWVVCKFLNVYFRSYRIVKFLNTIKNHCLGETW